MCCNLYGLNFYRGNILIYVIFLFFLFINMFVFDILNVFIYVLFIFVFEMLLGFIRELLCFFCIIDIFC